MKTIIKIFKFLILSLFVYLFISLSGGLFFNKELPMPTFYTNWRKSVVDGMIESDPTLKLGRYTDTLTNRFIIVTHQKDSLQHIVDSLLKKQ